MPPAHRRVGGIAAPLELFGEMGPAESAPVLRHVWPAVGSENLICHADGVIHRSRPTANHAVGVLDTDTLVLAPPLQDQNVMKVWRQRVMRQMRRTHGISQSRQLPSIANLGSSAPWRAWLHRLGFDQGKAQ